MTLSTERRIITVVVIISLTFFLSFALFPVYWTSITSVKPSHEISSTENPLVVLRPTLEHYHKLFTKTRFLYWFKNSVVVSGIATLIVVIVASFGAYSLARLNFRGRKIIGRSVLFSYLIPRIILAIPLFTILGILKLTDTLTGLILSYLTFALPFCTWLLIGYFQSVPTELEESAQIDGCTRVQALFKIVFPLVTPGIITSSVFTFTLSWNEFLYPLVFIYTDYKRTVPVAISDLQMGDIFVWGQIMAAGVIYSIPLLILYSLIQRGLVARLTAGAIKYNYINKAVSLNT